MEVFTPAPVEETTATIVVQDVFKTFSQGTREIQALKGVSLKVAPGAIHGLVGPDGAGKTTLIRLLVGLLTPSSGRLAVLGKDATADSLEVQSRAGYMPQRFGLYEDLSVQENLNLYADLQGVPVEQRAKAYPPLLRMTGLEPFTSRLAGKLSGGMKQKLGLACALLKEPEVLLLDEPTVGVDPLSRRELWQIVQSMVERSSITVLVATSYLDEAERCDRVTVMVEGRVLGEGRPQEFTSLAQGRTFRKICSAPARVLSLDQAMLLEGRQPAQGHTVGNRTLPGPVCDAAQIRDAQVALADAPGVVDATLESGDIRLVLDSDTQPADVDKTGIIIPVPARFEDGFMTLLKGKAGGARHWGNPWTVKDSHQTLDDKQPVIEVRNLERRFGSFKAVNNISFDVRRGEIFGLLGPNGAGKSTTFRMLCGLLPASGGTLSVAGVDLRRAAATARKRIGYVAQKFSLYGQLSVLENLDFFASAYGLSGTHKQQRIDWALHSLELAENASTPSGQLPFGYKQRLAMACALMHEPEILFLDEATSGVDPLARREFWKRIAGLARAGVTVIVTTHFMDEAEYCDRIAIIVSGELLALGTPSDIRSLAHQEAGKTSTVEAAFISLVENHRRRALSAGGTA